MNLYPNPTQGKVNIQSNIASLGNILLRNSQGLLQESLNIKEESPGNFVLDMKSFSSGIYYLTIDNEVRRVVKL